jgi:hypothetical protein
MKIDMEDDVRKKDEKLQNEIWWKLWANYG